MRVSFFLGHPVYNGLVMPYFDYCSPLWDTYSKEMQDKLQKYHNRAAGVISGASYKTRSTDVLKSLGWETLEKDVFEVKLF